MSQTYDLGDSHYDPRLNLVPGIGLGSLRDAMQTALKPTIESIYDDEDKNEYVVVNSDRIVVYFGNELGHAERVFEKLYSADLFANRKGRPVLLKVKRDGQKRVLVF